MTNAFLHLLLFILLDLAHGSVAGNKARIPFVTTPETKQQVLAIRGGALGIDPQLAGKIFSVAALTQGGLFTIAPMPQAKMYGWDKADPAVVQESVELIGASILATGIATYCMMFQGTDVYTAVGVTCIFWSIFFLRWLLNGTHAKAGMPTSKLLPTVAACLLGIYAGFTKPDWALTLFKAYDVVYALVALQEIFFTDAAGDFWGVTVSEEEKPLGRFLGRTFGYFFLQYRIQGYCLASGVEPAKAMAYGALAGLAYFLSSFFITKEVPGVTGVPAGYPYAFWLTFFSFMIPAILL